MRQTLLREGEGEGERGRRTEREKRQGRKGVCCSNRDEGEMEEGEGDGVVGNRNSNSNSGISDNSISHDVAQCLFSILRRRMNDASLRCQRKQLLPRLRKSGDGSGTGSGGGGKTGQKQRSACNGGDGG